MYVVRSRFTDFCWKQIWKFAETFQCKPILSLLLRKNILPDRKTMILFHVTSIIIQNSETVNICIVLTLIIYS